MMNRKPFAISAQRQPFSLGHFHPSRILQGAQPFYTRRKSLFRLPVSFRSHVRQNVGSPPRRKVAGIRRMSSAIPLSNSPRPASPPHEQGNISQSSAVTSASTLSTTSTRSSAESSKFPVKFARPSTTSTASTLCPFEPLSH